MTAGQVLLAAVAGLVAGGIAGYFGSWLGAVLLVKCDGRRRITRRSITLEIPHGNAPIRVRIRRWFQPLGEDGLRAWERDQITRDYFAMLERLGAKR